MAEAVQIEGTWDEIAARAAEFDGCRLRVTVLARPTPDAQSSAPLSLTERRRFLKLPRSERARILSEQADRLAERYEQDAEWRELLAGDIVE